MTECTVIKEKPSLTLRFSSLKKSRLTRNTFRPRSAKVQQNSSPRPPVHPETTERKQQKVQEQVLEQQTKNDERQKLLLKKADGGTDGTGAGILECVT